MEAAHGHAVLGHGPGLVGADYRRRAERLHGREPPDERPRAREAPEAGGERHRRDGRQALRDRGDGEGDRRLEHEADRLAAEDSRQADDAARPEREADQPTAEPLDLPLERGGPLSGEGDQLADPAQLRRQAGRGHDRHPASGDHRGPEVHHRASVGERRLGGEASVGVLVDRHALAGQGRLGGAETAAPDEPRVCRDMSSRLEDQQIAGNHLGGADPDDVPLPPYEGLRHRQGAQLRQRDAGPPLGEEPEPGVEEERGQDRERFDALPEGTCDDRSGQEEQDDETAELGEHETPQRRVGVLANGVWTDAREPAACFVGSEPRFRIDGQELQDLRRGEGVPLATDRGTPVGGRRTVCRRVRGAGMAARTR